MNKNYFLGLYEKAMPGTLSLAQKLACTGCCGYDFMEISIDETDEKLGRLVSGALERIEIKKAVSDSGVPIRTMCLSGHRKYPLGSETLAVRERGMEIMCRAVDFAAEIGIRMIQLAGYDEYYGVSNDTTRANFEKNLALSVEYAAKNGVILAFETMETPFMNTIEKAMVYVRKIGSPYLGVYPDIGNITNSGVDPVGDIECGRGHIFAAHLKQTLPGRFREVPYEEGYVDFVAAIRCFMEQGVRMYLAEFWHVGQPCWEEVIIGNRLFLESKFAEAQSG